MHLSSSLQLMHLSMRDFPPLFEITQSRYFFSSIPMEEVDHELIKDLDDSQETWRIVVRVWRRWTVRNQTGPRNMSSINMILVDEQANKIQATIGTNSLFEQHKKEIAEGKCYIIENFKVLDNNVQFRPTIHPYRIAFNLCTHIERTNVVLPTQCHSFEPISDIINGKASTDVLIDVVGFLKCFGHLDEFSRNNESHKRLCFTLADHEDNCINVVLFGECAHDAFCSKEEDLEPPIVVVLELARIKLNNGMFELANSWSATRVLFNPNIPQVKELIDRLPLCGSSETPSFTQEVLAYQSPSINTNLLTFPRRYTIRQLLATTQSTIAVIQVMIKKVETNFGWMYEGCEACSAKPKLKNNIPHCFGCKKDSPSVDAKFRIYYTVSDHTGSTSVVFFDRFANKLLDIPAKELKARLIQDERPYSFPKELQKLVGQKMILKVKLDDRNVNNKFANSTVLDYSNEVDELQKFEYSIGDDSKPSGCNVISNSLAHESSSEMQDREPISSTPVGSSASHDGCEYENLSVHETSVPTFVTPIQTRGKTKSRGKRCTDESQVLGLAEISTPSFSSTKPTKVIKQEKID